jgi:4a-hydroxytetrahydrobiopterin dehydratase
MASMPAARPEKASGAASHPSGGDTMATALAEKTCTPCRGGVPPLSPEEAEGYRAQAPDWALLDDATRIERRFRFKDFREAFAFVARAAELAEAEGPPPRHRLRLGLRDGLAADQEDQGPARERLHHGRKLDRLASGGAAETASRQEG